jgi:DNA gyrase/topoisomerase IV subunit B
MIRKLVEADYQEYLSLNKSQMPEGLYQSLKAHERIPMLFVNLSKELETIERRTKSLDRMKIKQVTYDMAQFFINCVKTQADEKQMSDAMKSALVANSKKMITEEEACEYTKELIAKKIGISETLIQEFKQTKWKEDERQKRLQERESRKSHLKSFQGKARKKGKS